jgi:hypothetical protein
LVEHQLPKLGVASSNLVFRSNLNHFTSAVYRTLQESLEIKLFVYCDFLNEFPTIFSTSRQFSDFFNPVDYLAVKVPEIVGQDRAELIEFRLGPVNNQPGDQDKDRMKDELVHPKKD